MADKKISQLTAVSTPLAGTEVLPIVQSGVTKKVTALELTGTTVDSAGNATIASGNFVIGTAGKGIDFSANSFAPGTTSKLLDDYEEGTWTATFKGTTGDPTTPVTATGTYTKIGRTVIVNCELLNFSTVGATGFAYITGLPFAIASGKVAVAAVYLYNFVVSYKYALCVAYNSDVTFEEVRDSSSTSPLSVSPGTARYLRFTLMYQV